MLPGTSGILDPSQRSRVPSDFRSRAHAALMGNPTFPSRRSIVPLERSILSPERSVFSPPATTFSPSDRSVFSPERVARFPPRRSVFSPERVVRSPVRSVFSPERLLTPGSCVERVMSPGRSVFSPERVVMSPGRSSLLSPGRSTVYHDRSVSFSERSPMSPDRSSSTASDYSFRSTSDYSFRSASSGARRVFPQASTGLGVEDLHAREQAPVVFDAGLSFVLGAGSQRMRRSFDPRPAHTQPATASCGLSSKIREFLRRTDHVMEEWRRLGRKDGDVRSLMDLPDDRGADYMAKSRSATNIAIRSFSMYSRGDSSVRSPSLTASRDDHDDDTLSDELSDLTADLAEEHSTSTLATERLEVETVERLRLERELQEVQVHNKTLQQTSERLEMELLYMRASDVNGAAGSDEEEEGADDAVYRQRYERVTRELEFTRRRLQQQHEDDLEQLVGLKKQLEKKLADAYEEVEEQRQVVGQWKRKVQKLNAETSDLRLLLEEQSSRNNLLEKKQRKFDSELQLLHDELRGERQGRERTSRERELAVAERFSLEQSLGEARLELELKEERLSSLGTELAELTFGGKTEEEVAALKKAKHELDKRLKEQEEELDDLAGQVQLLEQAKLRLEMSLEQQRKESRREATQRDEELEDARCNATKKVKALEAQLETEHEERTLLLRERHDLERRLVGAEEAARAGRHGDEEQLQRLRRDLRRTKALLRDAQTMAERARGDSPGKAALRQLRNQLEDVEMARSLAVKARQTLEADLSECQAQLEEAQKGRSDAEERAATQGRERAEITAQLEENEEELAEVLKKFRATVQQLSLDQASLQEQAAMVAELEGERAALREQLAELTSRLESMETMGDPSNSLTQRRLEMRIRELESRLELEQTTRARIEVQIGRLKDQLEKQQAEAASCRTREQAATDAARKAARAARELKDAAGAATAREAEAAGRRKELEKRLESAEAETATARGDLRLALARVEDLQSAILGELGSDHSSHSDSDRDSDASDDSINTFLANHKAPSVMSRDRAGPSMPIQGSSTPKASLELDLTQGGSGTQPPAPSPRESFA